MPPNRRVFLGGDHRLRTHHHRIDSRRRRSPLPAATARAALDELLAGQPAVRRRATPSSARGARPAACPRRRAAPVRGRRRLHRLPRPARAGLRPGIGDLLCIRTAGQVLDEAVLASVQYGVEELGVPLVLVLGHERCGAVTATLEHLRTGTRARPSRPPGGQITPAVLRTRAVPGDWADHTVRAQAAWVRDAIRAGNWPSPRRMWPPHG